ncbi:MAG: hypothetical protein HOW73_24205 [Polyangiaceae bacterium]|nr:hypothetical protein [Polyangiaceae bacterium]
MHDAYSNPPIIALEGLEPVRLRPGMFVGPTDNPLLPNILLKEDLLTLHACANAKPPLVATMTCTFGLAVLNALCSAMRLRIFQDGMEWAQSYARGAALTKPEVIGPTSESGTELLFTLDETILSAPVFSLDELASWARSSLVQLRLTLIDEVTGRQVVVPGSAG